jgi:DNA-directed RNA polymerase I, II, and III subunit RPABC2
MSYFDKQNGGADDSEDEKNNDSGSDSGSDSDLASDTNIDEDINEDDDDDDAEAKGLEDDDDDEGDEHKINFKEKYGVDFASNDDEDLIVFARKHKEKMKAEYGEDFGNNSEEDIKNVRKYFAEQREKAETEAEADDASETDESRVVTKKKTKKMPTKQKAAAAVYDEEDDEDPTGEAYLQKFDKEINDNYLVNFHPESVVHNYDEIMAMTKITRDKAGIIIDDLHKTIPFLTKYERARVLGQRAKQINSGASVFVKVPEKVIDGYLIAELELQEKRIPFIIRRPMPNGGSEYWSIKDLENISF